MDEWLGLLGSLVVLGGIVVVLVVGFAIERAGRRGRR